jgi:hypothetical protein
MKEEISQAAVGISPTVKALDLQLCRAAEAAGSGVVWGGPGMEDEG